MKRLFQNRNMIQKMAIVLLITLLCYFMIPTYSAAAWGGDLMKILIQLLAALGDAVSGAMNHFMLGTERSITSVMLSQDDPTITDPKGALYAGSEDPDVVLDQNNEEEKIDHGMWGDDDDWEVPNILYSPEAIFSNSVAALDVNFLNPNKYKQVQDGDNDSNAYKKSQSAAGKIKDNIGNWYVAFRNIAIVALLTVLVYIGIKILISSTSADKAKYKEGLKDWLVALALVFILHFIMSAILTITQSVTDLFETSSRGIIVQVGNATPFKLNLMGVARLRAQSSDWGVATIYCIIYIVLIFYTIMFTFTYLKRFLYMAFLTMIAPLVAITYPIDKMGDGQAQAFNKWFKEYTMNAILQPLHLILYTTLVSSANDLAVENPIYAIVAIGFLIPAEKFVKSMFGLNKADSPGGMGGFAAGAVAMKAMTNLAKKPKNLQIGKDGKKDKVRTVDNNNDYSASSGYDGLLGGKSNGNQPKTGTPTLAEGPQRSNQQPQNTPGNEEGEDGASGMPINRQVPIDAGEAGDEGNQNGSSNPFEAGDEGNPNGSSNPFEVGEKAGMPASWSNNVRSK